MPSVNIRVEKVDDAELNAKKQGDETVAKDKGESTKLAVASIFAHQALNVGKQIVNYQISHIGDMTGDYVKQEQAQEIVDAVGTLAGIGIALATGNYAMAAVATVGAIVKKGFEIKSENMQIRHAENNAEYLRKRSGNSLENNSRTGD